VTQLRESELKRVKKSSSCRYRSDQTIKLTAVHSHRLVIGVTAESPELRTKAVTAAMKKPLVIPRLNISEVRALYSPLTSGVFSAASINDPRNSASLYKPGIEEVASSSKFSNSTTSSAVTHTEFHCRVDDLSSN
jgi:hypothetical protein